jgi:hypothetical protein
MSTPRTGAAAGPCAGDLTPAEAWERLAADPAAILVDVRTRIDLALTGGPDLSSLSREPVFAEWMTQQGRNPGFLDELKTRLAERGAGAQTPVCRRIAQERYSAAWSRMNCFRAMGSRPMSCLKVSVV